MTENRFWGYNTIYGPEKPEYHESLPKDMNDALNYLCARVRRSGDFWNALRTASAMYGVNSSDLRINFEKRKKAGIERKKRQRKKNEKWYAVRCTTGTSPDGNNTVWMFLKADDPEKAMQAAAKKYKKPDCRISVEQCIPFETRAEADSFASSWEKDRQIRQLPLPEFV